MLADQLQLTTTQSHLGCAVCWLLRLHCGGTICTIDPSAVEVVSTRIADRIEARRTVGICHLPQAGQRMGRTWTHPAPPCTAAGQLTGCKADAVFEQDRPCVLSIESSRCCNHSALPISSRPPSYVLRNSASWDTVQACRLQKRIDRPARTCLLTNKCYTADLIFYHGSPCPMKPPASCEHANLHD